MQKRKLKTNKCLIIREQWKERGKEETEKKKKREKGRKKGKEEKENYIHRMDCYGVNKGIPKNI